MSSFPAWSTRTSWSFAHKDRSGGSTLAAPDLATRLKPISVQNRKYIGSKYHLLDFIGITVDKEGHDYLGQMCGDMAYEVLDNIELLPARLPSLYRRLTE